MGKMVKCFGRNFMIVLQTTDQLVLELNNQGMFILLVVVIKMGQTGELRLLNIILITEILYGLQDMINQKIVSIFQEQWRLLYRVMVMYADQFNPILSILFLLNLIQTVKRNGLHFIKDLEYKERFTVKF